MARKKQELPANQADGSSKEEAAPVGRSTYEILNRYRTAPYKHTSVAEYSAYIRSLTLAQLQDHAITTGSVIPCDDRDRLANKLIDEFASYLSKTQRIDSRSIKPVFSSEQDKNSTESIMRKYNRNMF